MPTPTDVPFELIRTALENTLRSFTLAEETQQHVLRLQLTAMEDAVRGARDAINEVSSASDWSALGALPGVMLRQGIEQNTNLVQNCLKLCVDTQAAWLSRARDASESMQRCQADALASGATVGAGFPLQAMFDRIGEAAQTTSNAAGRAASSSGTDGQQGAMRGNRRTQHAG